MNTNLRKKTKNDFVKYFFKLMNNAVFGETMENMRKHRDIKLVITERKRNYLVSKQYCHTIKIFSENLLAIEMKKTEILMNRPVCLRLLILELSKLLMYEFWYDYVKPKYGQKAKLYYRDTNNFVVYIKTDDIFEYIAENVKTRFDSSNYELDRPLPKGKKK